MRCSGRGGESRGGHGVGNGVDARVGGAVGMRVTATHGGVGGLQSHAGHESVLLFDCLPACLSLPLLVSGCVNYHVVFSFMFCVMYCASVVVFLPFVASSCSTSCLNLFLWL